MRALLAAGVLACAASPALALDLNGFRAQNKLPPLSELWSKVGDGVDQEGGISWG